MPNTRAPLGEISGNRPKKNELTPIQRGFIEGAIKFGASFSKVAEIVDCGKTTVSDTLRLTSERCNGESKPRSGRPRKWDIGLERRILRIVRVYSKWTYRQIRESIDDTLSKETIYRILKKNNITNWIAKKRPFISPEVARKRLNWALLYQDWSSEEWGTVI